jgi:hypothetical protein
MSQKRGDILEYECDFGLRADLSVQEIVDKCKIILIKQENVCKHPYPRINVYKPKSTFYCSNCNLDEFVDEN